MWQELENHIDLVLFPLWQLLSCRVRIVWGGANCTRIKVQHVLQAYNVPVPELLEDENLTERCDRKSVHLAVKFEHFQRFLLFRLELFLSMLAFWNRCGLKRLNFLAFDSGFIDFSVGALSYDLHIFFKACWAVLLSLSSVEKIRNWNGVKVVRFWL